MLSESKKTKACTYCVYGVNSFNISLNWWQIKKKMDPFCLLCVEATALLGQQDNNTDSKCYLLVKSKSDKRNITVLFGQRTPLTHCRLLAALLHLYSESLLGIYREDIGGSKWLPKFSAFRDGVKGGMGWEWRLCVNCLTCCTIKYNNFARLSRIKHIRIKTAS